MVRPSLPPTRGSVGPPMRQRARSSGSISHGQTLSIGASSRRAKRRCCGVKVSLSAIVFLQCGGEARQDHGPALAGLFLIGGPGRVYFVGLGKARTASMGGDVDRHVGPFALLRRVGAEAEDEAAWPVARVEQQVMARVAASAAH